MPVKVKPMEPKWIEAYNALPPTPTQQDEVEKAMNDYRDTTNDAATNLNKRLKEITGIVI